MFSKFQMRVEIWGVKVVINRMRQFPQLITLATLFGIWAFVLRGAFNGDRLFSLYEDNEFLLGPLISGISHMYLNGVLPLRLDTILGGFPLYNFTQITPFYPFYGFFLGIYNGYLATVKSLHWLTLLHLLLLLVNMNVLLRTIGVDRISAITGATLFTFGADMLVYKIWLNIVAPYAWLPLYIAGVIGVVQNQHVWKNSIFALVAILMIVSASPSQPLIHAVLLTIFISIGYVIHCFKEKTANQLIRPLLALAAIATLCFLICAPMLLPALMESGKMIRWIGNFPAIFLNEKIPFEAYVFYKFHIKDAWEIFFYKGSHMVGSAYVGFFAIPLVMLAFLKKGNWLVIVLLTTAIYSLLSSFGDEAGLAYINHKLPLLNKIREPSRFLALFQFSVAVLASIGLYNLRQTLESEKSDSVRCRKLLTLSAIVAITTFALSWPQFQINTSEFIRFIACVILILLTLFLLKHELIIARKFLAIIWPIATLASLFTAVHWQPPLAISDSVYLKNNYASLDMAIAHVAERDPHSEFRLIFDGDLNKGYAAMLASYRGVRTFTYYINPAPIKQAVDFSYDYSPYYAYQGAAFLICKQCDLEKYKSFKFLKSFGDFNVYFDSNAYPRSFLGKVAGSFNDTLDFIEKVKGEPPGFDRKVYLENGSSAGVARVDSKKECSLSTSFSSAIRHELLVDCDAGHVIVLNEYHDGNWVGYVNGAKVNVLKVNGNQNGIVLSDNSQFVTFEYRPSIFINSLALVPLGFIIIILLYFLVPNHTKKGSQPSVPAL